MVKELNALQRCFDSLHDVLVRTESQLVAEAMFSINDMMDDRNNAMLDDYDIDNGEDDTRDMLEHSEDYGN